jgi:hypothetical protein
VKKWDIYFANVPFEDIPQAKPRPVIVLEDSTVVVDCLKMTSQPPRQGEYVLQYWKEAGLMKPTVVRISKRLRLSPSDFIKRFGTLHPIDIIEIQKRLTL